MFRVRQPFFKLDDAPQGWEMFDAPADDASADDEQLETDSDAEDLEDGKETESVEDEAEDDVSDDADDADEEDDPDAEEGDADDQTLSDDTEVDLGEGRQPVKLSELKQGYLRQSDYTKKTQALADERKTFETERTQMTPIKQMSDFLDGNPYLREQIQLFIKEFTQTGQIPLKEALEDAAYGQYINALMTQNQQLTRELQDVQGKFGELEFTGTMKDLKTQLKTEYGKLATDEYLKTLEDRAKTEKLSPSVLREIADAHLAKQKLAQEQTKSKKAAKDAESKTYQKMREKADNLPASPRKKGQVPNSNVRADPHEPIGWDEVF